MIQDVSVLHTQIAQFLQGRSSGRTRYPRELKASILEHARLQRSRKISRDVIAAELGLSIATLHCWLYAKRPESTLKPVTVRAVENPIGSVVLITRDGHRVEGLDVDGMAQLLRGLS